MEQVLPVVCLSAIFVNGWVSPAQVVTRIALTRQVVSTEHCSANGEALIVQIERCLWMIHVTLHESEQVVRFRDIGMLVS